MILSLNSRKYLKLYLPNIPLRRLKYLGVILGPHLNWKLNIEERASKKGYLDEMSFKVDTPLVLNQSAALALNVSSPLDIYASFREIKNSRITEIDHSKAKQQ